MGPLGPTVLGRTRSRTATLTGNTPLRPGYRMAARSEIAASAAPPPPLKAPLRSSSHLRLARLGSTIPPGRPTSPRMATVPNPLMDYSPPAASSVLQCATPDNKTSAAAEQQLFNTLLSYSHSDWDRAQRADPLCDATRHYIQLGRSNPLPRSLCDHLLSHTRPETADIADLAAKGRLLQGDNDSILLVRKPITTALAPDAHNSRRSRTPFDDPIRIYVLHGQTVDRARMPRRCLLLPRCHTHTQNTGTLLLVGKYGKLH